MLPLCLLNLIPECFFLLGIEWGGYWQAGNFDAPHFEILKLGYT